jgi:hypothetical protein
MGTHLLRKIFPAEVFAPGMDSVDFRQLRLQFAKIHKPPHECKKKRWQFNALANINEIGSTMHRPTISTIGAHKKRGPLASRPRRLQEYVARFS